MHSVAVSGPSERRVRIAAVTCALVGALPVFLAGGLAVQIDRDFAFGPARIGVASGVYFAGAAAGSAAMGRVAERLGPGVSMRAAIVVGGMFLGLLSIVGTYPVMLLLLAAAGVGNSLAQVSANLLVARGVAPERQGWSLSIKQAGVPAATLLGGLAVPVVAVTVGWRWAFAGACGLAALAFFVVPADGVRRAPDRRTRAAAPDVPLRHLVVLATAVGFATAANGSVATFLVTAGVEAGFGESAAGLMLTLGAGLGITMRLLVGRLADRRGARHLPVVSVLLVGGTIGYVVLATATTASFIAGTVLAFGSGWAWPGLFNLSVVRLNPSAPGAATGITQTGVYVGALAGPVLFGLVVDRFGYPWAWLAAAVASTGAAAGVVIGRARILRWRDSIGSS